MDKFINRWTVNWCTNVETKVLIIVGSKELKTMKKSANKLHAAIPNSDLFIADNMGHGEFSLVQYNQYLKLIKSFLLKDEIC